MVAVRGISESEWEASKLDASGVNVSDRARCLLLSRVPNAITYTLPTWPAGMSLGHGMARRVFGSSRLCYTTRSTNSVCEKADKAALCNITGIMSTARGSYYYPKAVKTGRL